MENIDPRNLSDTALQAIVAIKTDTFAEECRAELARRKQAKAIEETPAPPPEKYEETEANIDQTASNDLKDVINRIRRNPKQGGAVS